MSTELPLGKSRGVGVVSNCNVGHLGGSYPFFIGHYCVAQKTGSNIRYPKKPYCAIRHNTGPFKSKISKQLD